MKGDKMKYFSSLLVMVLSVLLIACGGKKNEEKQESTKMSDEPVIVNLTGNDQMQYNLKTIEVPAGSKVKVNLTHIGKMPKTVMGHNFILLKPNTDLAEFATAAMTAKDSDYIPASKSDEIIAHTSLVGGGETTSVEFDAPAKGTYKFMCSFPGHYATMQGDFIVK